MFHKRKLLVIETIWEGANVSQVQLPGEGRE